MALRTETLGREVEIRVHLNVAEAVAEVGRVLLHHGNALPADLQLHLLRYGLSVDRHDDFEVLRLGNEQRVVLQDKAERSLRDEFTAVREQPFRGTGDQARCCEKQDDQQRERREGIPKMATVAP